MKQPFYQKNQPVLIKGINKKGIVKDVAKERVKLTYFSRDTDKRITAWFDVSQIEEYKPKSSRVGIAVTVDKKDDARRLAKAFTDVVKEALKSSDNITNAMKDLSCKVKPLQIKVKYFADIEPLQKITQGDWIDLRSAVDITLKKGEYALIPLGVGMKLPEGYEANPVPRSSTYTNFGIIQTNHFGVIDNTYSGNEDQWHFPALAMRDTVIKKNDRICQFRIQKVMPEVELVTVDNLDEVSRGGIGSTGKN